VTWPTPQEYNEAVQNPRANFRDPELQACRPDLTALGLPRPITGNFASVYRLTAGGRAMAVRCFFREFTDMRARYAAISSHLQASKLPYTVGFTYLDEGIAIRRSGYPVLKMEWVQGELLDDYIRRNLRNQRALRDLARSWLQLAFGLRGNGMAHGDLQHGNVLVANGAIRLVDYDGMYVPALAGKPSLELGHPSYQHPRRDGALFGPNMDNFSHWVIYTSLIAMAADPNLWDGLEAGDERLLFSRSDFTDPETSGAFRALTNHEAAPVRSLATRLRQFLDLAPERVPSLDPMTADTGNRGRWRPIRRSTSMGSAAPAPSALPEWVAEHVVPAARADFAQTRATPRVCLAICLGAGVVQLLPGVGDVLPVSSRIALSGGVFGLGWSILTAFYVLDGGVRNRLRLEAERLKTLLEWQWLESRSRALQRRTLKLAHRIASEQERLAMSRAAIEDRTASMRGLVGAQVQSAMEPLKQSLALLKSAQEDEISRALRAYQQRFLEAHLRDHSVRAARINHLGWSDKARLWAWGVRSATDVDPAHASTIARLGPRPEAALAAWRAGLLRQGMRSIPAEAPPAARDQIRAKYARRLGRIERLRRQVLLDATPVLAALSELSTFQIGRAEERFARNAAALDSHRSRVDIEASEVKVRQARLIRRVEEIDQNLVPLAGLTYSRYLLRLFLGRRPWLILGRRF
jgi:hypothetical protein